MNLANGRRARAAIWIILCLIPAWFVVRPYTFRPGEAAILLMPPALGAMLWVGWPRVRRVSVLKIVLYFVVLGGLVAGAEQIAASFVGGRVLPLEVLYGTYCIVAVRLAWEIWKRVVGTLGESRRRLARRPKEISGRPTPFCVHLIAPARTSLTILVFIPLVVGSLIHRVKIGNPLEMRDYRSLDLQPVSIPTDDGLTLSGWFLPDAKSDSTIIICHGAGANKANFIGFLTLCYGSGFNSVIFDFRGHGDSDGHTTTFGLLESRDVTAVVNWLKKSRPEQSRHVFGLGSSMGAMSLVRAAADDPRIEAVVLDSCFVSAPEFAMNHARKVPVVGPMFVPLMLAGVSANVGHSMWELDAREAIAKLSPRPVFLIHGDEDTMIPPGNMEELYACAREPKQKWLGHGPHSNVLAVEYDEYLKRVVAFFRSARGPISHKNGAAVRGDRTKTLPRRGRLPAPLSRPR